uniref:protein Lines homolog 1 isoform X2 n=1 Tax=Solea senegalensis TaxID=28829 RepID=UPI001CD85B54|nr:protein Lines homolog 1 isoform X2 [Solea senegalensis]
MTDSFSLLTDVFKCFHAGSCPRQSSADVAAAIFSCVCGLSCSPAAEEEQEQQKNSRGELSCMSVTLVENMVSLLNQDQDQDQPADVTQFCVDAVSLLFHHMDLMTQLVRHFHSEEQIVSHLAAKCASTYVVYYLLKSGAVSVVWQQKCVEVFHCSAPGAELDVCLWSLTEVLKKLLKTAHREVIRTLVSAFDSALSALCSAFLSEEKQHWMVLTSSREHWGTTFCLLLDLLEALTASGLTCDVSLKSQKSVYAHAPALLTAVASSSEYYVKKRAMLLLKRAVLQKAGEDWTSGEASTRERLGSDVNVLAQTVLTAVAAEWLQSVQVESESFFGGTRRTRVDEGQKPDCVMLRAVSLLLLKSMELHVQTAGAGAAAADGVAEVYEYLQRLWTFLRRCSVQLSAVTHLCCWLPLLFGEQDDDMMEAAKASLCIFLHHRLRSGSDNLAALDAACASGCNPHCHFLSLLQSVSFDHSLLLDFLISTETCFLEYFVRYLKLVASDWQGFAAACEKVASSSHSRTPPPTQRHEAGCSSRVQPTGGGVGVGLRLVAYESSDESDSENMEVPVCAETQNPTFNVKAPRLLTDAAVSGQNSSCETLTRAVVCLSEVGAVVTRLQTKKLFPYNPTSLLRLLAQVQTCSQQSPLSHVITRQ